MGHRANLNKVLLQQSQPFIYILSVCTQPMIMPYQKPLHNFFGGWGDTGS
jgi:hypothetical protein